ncbi:MarR family winged helix-turn-helix transcriptional regulator [Nocardioides sp. T2.26MG-1]|uniref:MarR family winged helix-turn-helix transcriptional regulator n=1 Tax=Nocardioides sp. T2.26MG-1 TaxID=3041166 RepID=UPI00247751E7|nr:MarR family transcriptional regulator [Nocardioides sp. T2.26MG-1]CAI9400699.1 hypothetical protein HIDPHFAB_00456 [Nocardioides sp. T2.26MG-1]
MSRSGADLALLLLGGYRKLVEAVVAELEVRGYPDARPVLEFAMRAIDAGADSASELGRRLSVSKQAAAKTIATLVERGYVDTEVDPSDRRRKRVRVTDRGHALMREGEAIFDELRDEWARTLGADGLARLERDLAAVVGDSPLRVEAAGWAAQES